MLLAVLSGFLASAAIPFTRRDRQRFLGWVYPLLPLGLTAYFALRLPALLEGVAFRSAREWFPGFGLSLDFYLDAWSVIFVLLITGIGALVMVYAGGYLGVSASRKRFFCALFIFMASMLGTVLSANALLLFVFWELTSLSSYFLIGFDHEEESSRRNALQALLVTGAGGLAMLAGFLMIGTVAGTYDIQAWCVQRHAIQAHPFFVPALVLVLLGAFTKSAQFPFHFWLPNAMVAPTPVSAYLHSSTMVKAGIYLLGRLFPIFGTSDAWTAILTATGTLTMLAGALMAVRASDLKKHLAYLTISALGLLVLLIGSGSAGALHAAAIFLVAHALYKGSLFMVAGSLLHSTGLRDPEQLSGLWKKMPVTAAISIAAGASLASLPPLMGFFAKETAMESASPALLPAIALAGMVYTAMFFWIAAKPFTGKRSDRSAHEVPFTMWSGAAVLAAMGLVFPVVLPVASPFWERAASAMWGEPFHRAHHGGHGINPVILWSVASWIGGAAIYASRRPIRAFLSRFGGLLDVGPDAGYHGTVKNLVVFAAFLAKTLQHGSLRGYFRVFIGAIVVLAGWGLVRAGAFPVRPTPFYFFEAGLAVMIVVGAFATILTAEKLAAVAYLGVVGLAISLIFLLYGAPDLAMTQFAVEVLTLILLALVLYRLPHFQKVPEKKRGALDAVLSVSAGFVMFLFVLAATYHEEGRLPAVADFYVKNSLSLAHGRNIVNVILVDFRGLDTLGEITVLGIAGIGVYALLKLVPGRKKGGA